VNDLKWHIDYGVSSLRRYGCKLGVLFAIKNTGVHTLKKLIGILIVLAAMSVLIGSAFTAAFFDTEGSNKNSLTAGTLDLQLGDTDQYVLSFTNKDPLAPGRRGDARARIGNIGDVDGNFYIDVWIANDLEGENPPSETNIDPGDGGELDNCLDIRASLLDGTSETVIVPFVRADQLAPAFKQQWDLQPYTPVDNLINGDHQVTLYLEWMVDPTCGNEMMGDTLDLNFKFHLDQY
jgi:hypothetical protein